MITVLMPTYNLANTIKYSINSVLSQTFKTFELLIVDDGSTDDTKKIIESFSDSRIRYVYKNNSGLVDSLNYGLSIAKYELISRIDGDDIFHPTLLEKQINFLKENPSVGILSAQYAVFSDNQINFAVKSPTRSEDIKNGLVLHSHIQHPSAMYNRDFILNNGGYKDDEIEDYGLWLRLKDKTEFSNIPEVLLFYRYGKKSLSRIRLKERNRLHYRTQNKIYNSELVGFNFSEMEKVEYKGWREYFFGEPEKARNYWRKIFFKTKDYRVYLAYFVSFLPEKLFIAFKESRVRYRLKYLFNYFSAENRSLRKELNNLLKP